MLIRFIRCFASNGLVTTSLLDMADINQGSNSQVMFQTCNSLLTLFYLGGGVGGKMPYPSVFFKYLQNY